MADISKINPNGTEYNLKDATARNAIQSSKTLKSSVVTVTDAAPINAEDITVDITPIQDLHGYDRPWAGGAGKNKLPMTVAGVKTANNNWGSSWSENTLVTRGITIDLLTDSGNNLIGIKFNGTCSEQFIFNFIGSATPYVANTYGGMKFNGFDGQTSPSQYCNIMMYSNDGTYWANEAYQAGGNDTVILSSYNYVSIGFLIRSGQTLNNVVVRPMLRLSTETDATFAPYSNECPIEGRTGAELDRVGKNWFDGTFTDIAPQIVTYRSIAVPNGTYTLSSSCPLNSGQGANIFFLAGNVQLGASTNGNGVWAGQNRTVTTTNGYVTIAYRLDGGIDPRNYSTQLELGTQPTAYEPYQGQQYTANFGETVYGGKWHVTKGGTDNEMAKVDLSSLTWNLSWSTPNTFYATISPYSKSDYSKSLASNYKYVGGRNGTNSMHDDADGSIALYNGNNAYEVYIKDKGYSTAEEFNSASLGTLAILLATPTTISTPKQNVPMLKGINTVSADCGDVSLKYQPDNVIGELKGEIQKANSFVSKMALREGSGAKDFSYGGWSFRLYIYRSMGQISMSVERISASSVIEQAVIKTFNGESDYRAPEDLRPIFGLIQAATYTTPSGWALQVHLTDEGYIMFEGMAPAVGASAPTSSNWNLVEPWATHQQAKDLFNN